MASSTNNFLTELGAQFNQSSQDRVAIETKNSKEAQAMAVHSDLSAVPEKDIDKTKRGGADGESSNCSIRKRQSGHWTFVDVVSFRKSQDISTSNGESST